MIYKLIAIVLLAAALLGIGLLQENLNKGRLTESVATPYPTEAGPIEPTPIPQINGWKYNIAKNMDEAQAYMEEVKIYRKPVTGYDTEFRIKQRNDGTVEVWEKNEKER